MNEDLINVRMLTPFRKFVMSVGEIPSAYMDSMTYYEMLNWFCNYLQNEVIPSVNTNASAVQELQNLYIELKGYVDNYFDNLDVQEEINNKLDDMASNGDLTELIKEYVDPIQESYENNINSQFNTFKNNVNNQINEINTKVNQSTSGSPLSASSVSEMTDTSRVYVNTTDGYWYYYNGTNWVQGGIYQSNGIANNSIKFSNLTPYLNNLINNKLNELPTYKVIGTISTATGSYNNIPGNNRLRLNAFYKFKNNIILNGNNLKVYIYKYTEGRQETYTNYEEVTINNSLEYNINPDLFYCFVFRKNDDTDLTQNDIDSISIYEEVNNQNELVNIIYEQGSLSSGNGGETTGNTRIRTKFFTGNKILILPEHNYYTLLFKYDKNYNFIERYVLNYTYESDLNLNNYYRIVVLPKNNEEVTPENNSNYLYVKCEINDDEENLANFENYQNSIKHDDNLLVAFPSTNFGESYGSGMCLVDDYLLHFGVSNDDHTNYIPLNIYHINKKDGSVKMCALTNTHNFGHVNSISYCKANDSLVFGNGGSDFTLKGKFYVYPNFKQKLNECLRKNTQLEISNCIEYDCTDLSIGNEYKFNCCWSDGNRGRYNSIILVTNNFRTIRKIVLGKGINQLEYGNFISGRSENEFNGTFKIMKEYHLDTGETGTSNLYPVQDMCYYDNHLYAGVGHGLMCFWKLKLNDDGSVDKETITLDDYDDSGNIHNSSVGCIEINHDFNIVGLGLICVYSK